MKRFLPFHKSTVPLNESKNKSRMKTLRRISQVVFLFLFIFFLVNTEYHGTFDKPEEQSINYPVKFFMELDPLVTLSTALSTHTIVNDIGWALAIIIGTILVGRFFCGWICPLGTINHFFSSYKPERKGKSRVTSNRYKKWMTIKYYILIAFLVLALFTSLQTGLLDPIPFLYRSLVTSIVPSLEMGLRSILNALYDTNIYFFQAIANSGYSFFKLSFLSNERLYFHFSFIIGFIFILVLILNRFITRFWCRGICPLGAFLGLLSRFSIYGLKKDNAKCNDCNKCLLHCQGACEPQGGVPWRQAECHLCYNCETDCTENAIHFKFFPQLESIIVKPDLKRRRILESALIGAVLLPIIRATSGGTMQKNYNPGVIRPPSSLDEPEFLTRCIRCGECMKVCPTNAIQPTLFEAGVEGIWTPTLIMRIGYCEYTCILCGQVCPTGAIKKFTEDEKLGRSAKTSSPDSSGQQNTAKPIKIGTAYCDRNRCFPWVLDTPCIVCEEFCPTSPKAIWVREEEVTHRDGTKLLLKRPYVDEDLCIGCGICEYICPVNNKPAIYVTNIGETRSRTNRSRLEGDTEK